MTRMSHAVRRARGMLLALALESLLVVSTARAEDAPRPADPVPPAVPAGGPQDRGPAPPPQPPPPVAPSAAPGGDAAPEVNPPAPPAWQGRLDELDRRTRALEQGRLVTAAPPAGPVFQTDEGGFAIVSRDGRYQVRLKGLLQFDGRAFVNDSALEANNTFVVRKVRPILAGTVLGLTDFFFSPDFGNGTTVLTDAYLDTHPVPWLRIRVGKFKQPYGLERLQADQDLTLIERALDQNLTPQREVGVELWGDIAGGIVRYEAGAFNGNPDYGIQDIDINGPKTLGGRIFVQPFNTVGLKFLGRLGLGVAASTGTEKGSTANSWLPSFKTAGQSTIFSYLSSSTDATQNIFALGRHSRINPQLYYYNGPFGLLAEWVKERQEIARGSATGALKNSAGHVTASVAVGGDVTYEGVKPYHSLNPAAGTWGAVEIGGRFNWLDIDSAAFPTAASPTASVRKARGYGVALNWQLSRNLKASGNWEQTWFTGGATGTASRKTEDVLIGRFQVAF